MSETKSDKQIRQFLEKLDQLDPSERGQLKRYAGFSLEQASSAWRLFYRVLPRGVYPPQEPIYFLIAVLYTLAGSTPKGNLGDSLRAVRNPRNASWLDNQVERLLNARFEELPYYLSRLMGTLGSVGIRVNWSQLLKDVFLWTSDSKWVQKRWARAYYG